MKKLLILVVVVFSLAGMMLLSGCGSSGSGNIIKDEGSLVKIMDEFKNLDGLKGQDIMVFQDLSVITGESGNRVVINILKPGTDDEVDNYEYRNGWSKPNPVQLSGSGKAIDNCIPLSKFDFSKVPVMYKAMEEKIKDIKDAKIDDYFMFQYWNGEWNGSLSAKSPRAKYNADFSLDGNMTEFKKS